MIKPLIAALFCAAGLFAAPVAAQAQTGETEALRAEVAELKARLAQLEARIDAQADPAAQTPAANAPVRATATVASPSPPVTVNWDGAPELLGPDGWSFKPGGRLQYDAAIVEAPGGVAEGGQGFDHAPRRIRLGVGGTVPGGFGYKLEVDLLPVDTEIMDAFLSYRSQPLTLWIGQRNGFQGLEELTSSNDSSFIERAAFTDALEFERRVGIFAQYSRGPLLVQGSVSGANIAEIRAGTDDSTALDGRLVYAPELGATQLHFGGSVHSRTLGGALREQRYRQRPLVRTTELRFVDTGALNIESTLGYGLEAAAIRGRFHVAAETYWQRPRLVEGPEPLFFGGAIEAGYFITDDSRSYGGGQFGGVAVQEPVSTGGIGAIQINVRYDRLDLGDDGITGGIQNGYMASLIWTPVDEIRFLLNYAHLFYEDAVIGLPDGDRDYAVDVLGARAQIVF